MKIGVLGSNNIFVEETTNYISKYLSANAIILKNNSEKCNIDNNIVNLTFIDKKSIFSLLKLPFVIKKTEANVDLFIVHYLNLYFAILLAFGLFKKPVAYFCYGGDIRKKYLRKLFVKKALKKINLILVELTSQKHYLHSEYRIPENKIDSSILIFPVSPIFKVNSLDTLENIRLKWGLSNKYVIFSPRFLDAHYNHHILVEGLNLLPSTIKKDIQVVITGVGDIEYIHKLLELGRRYHVNIINLGRYLTPKEMAEIFNVSLINVNIPKHDQFGRSIIEGSLCGSIPLVSLEIETYHDLFDENKNCIFVSPTPEDIAEKTEYILKNYQEIKDSFYKNNFKLFEKRTDNDKNTLLLLNRLNTLINEV